MMFRHALRAILLLGAVSGAAQAQRTYLTDAGSPMGAGAGASGSLNSAVTGAINRATALAATFGSRPSIFSNAQNALIAALGGNPAALNAMLSGVDGGEALGNAMAQLGTNPTPSNVIVAVQAYNAVVAANPAGPSPAYLAAMAVFSTLHIDFKVGIVSPQS